MFEYFIVLCLGFMLGFYWTLDRVKSMVHDMQQAEEQQTEISEITPRLEKHGDQLYLFDKHTDQFLAQGRDRAELIQVLCQRFNARSSRVIYNDQEVQDQLAQVESTTKQ